VAPPLSRRSRNFADRVVAPYITGLADHLSKVQQSILDLHDRLGWIEDELRRIPRREESHAKALAAKIDARLDEIDARSAIDRQMLRAIYERADEQRLRLYALRQTEDYELAFTEEEPLVSYVIPTYNRFELLRDRALPSILNQTYGNFEVIVSGDQSPPETEQVVRELDDPRIRFINRTIRGPYPEDPHKRWMMSGTPPMNDAVAIARGRWISIVCDDDELAPTHTETLVRVAQERRLENCYGRLRIRFADGGEMDWESKFPPAYRHYTLQLAVYHAGLRFFQYEPTDVFYGEPNDWSLVRRMVAAGVRFGRTDDLVVYRHEDRDMPVTIAELENAPEGVPAPETGS
jgi:Glycosyl transferase family 2